MIRYICMKGYKTKNKVPLTSTCLDNGTWSSVELTCLPEAVFGTDIYELNNTYYKLVQMEQDWESAKATCDGMGLHLVDIKYQEEQLFITDNIVHDYDCYWTGGRRRNDKLVWLDGTDIAASNGWNWGNNQPSNYGGSQNCITLKDYNGYKWNDKSCSDQCYVICELAQ
ncbi:CD209 antigen-like protein E [Mercenaria mercenaria]|uniref:CD209 antigen-like protein E n=1 Tax=Mercenaria mercenaria TaxID=6596 RepID=UPI00234F088B|nr:CD209 antigen-like protein E [Mercenaria mercenaria]